MRKSHNVVGNEEINLDYFNKRLKKAKSIMSKKKSINLTANNENEENAILPSRTFINNVPNNYSMVNQNKENDSIERNKSENKIADKIFKRRMGSKKVRQYYGSDSENIKEKKDNKENKENKEKALEINEQLQEDKKMKNLLNIKLVNGFINKVNSLKSDDKNNGKINFEQFIESGFLQKEGIILCDDIEVEKKPNKIDILMKLMEDYRDRVLESSLCKNFQDRIILNIYISLSQMSFKLYNEMDNNKEIYLRRYLCNLANNIKFNSSENPNRALYSINQKLIDIYDKKMNIKDERNEYRNFNDEDEDYIYEKLDEFDSSDEDNISNKNEKEEEEEYFNIDKMNIKYGLEYSNETFENDDFSYIRDIDIEDKIKRNSTLEKEKNKNNDKNNSNINQNVKKKLNFQIIDFNSINSPQKKNKNNDNEDVFEIDLNSGGKSTLVFKEDYDKNNELREKKYHFNIHPDENTNKKNRLIQELSFIAYNNIINIITKGSKFLPKYEYHLEPGEIMKYIEEKEKQYLEINDDDENKIKIYRENKNIKFNDIDENKVRIPMDNKYKYKKSKTQKIKLDIESDDSNSGFDSMKSGTQNSFYSINKKENSTKILNFDIDDE